MGKKLNNKGHRGSSGDTGSVSQRVVDNMVAQVLSKCADALRPARSVALVLVGLGVVLTLWSVYMHTRPSAGPSTSNRSPDGDMERDPRPAKTAGGRAIEMASPSLADELRKLAALRDA